MRSGVLRIRALGLDGTLIIRIENGLPVGGTTIPNGLNINLGKSDGAGPGYQWSFEEFTLCKK